MKGYLYGAIPYPSWQEVDLAAVASRQADRPEDLRCLVRPPRVADLG